MKYYDWEDNEIDAISFNTGMMSGIYSGIKKGDDMYLVETTAHKVAVLKDQLASMDYKTNKYIEGLLTDEEWAEVKAERKTLRDRINELENEV